MSSLTPSDHPRSQVSRCIKMRRSKEKALPHSSVRPVGVRACTGSGVPTQNAVLTAPAGLGKRCISRLCETGVRAGCPHHHPRCPAPPASPQDPSPSCSSISPCRLCWSPLCFLHACPPAGSAQPGPPLPPHPPKISSPNRWRPMRTFPSGRGRDKTLQRLQGAAYKLSSQLCH